MYKHIIWDFDGTLFDTYPVMVQAMMKTLGKNNIEETEENIFKLMKISYPHLLKYLKDNYNINEEFVQEFKLSRKEFEDEYLKPFAGAEEICQKIVQHNKCNYLFTHRGKSAVYYLEKYNMSDSFAELIIKETGFARKPSPEGIDYLLDKYNIDKSQAIIIGDRGLDLESGKNAGISSCYFNIIDDKMLDSADYMVSDIDELYKMIF